MVQSLEPSGQRLARALSEGVGREGGRRGWIRQKGWAGRPRDHGWTGEGVALPPRTNFATRWDSPQVGKGPKGQGRGVLAGARARALGHNLDAF